MVQRMYRYENDEELSMAIVVILSVISVAGLFINSFLIYMLERIPEKSTSFRLIRMVGVADLLLCLFTLAVCISRPVLGYAESYGSWFYCPILSSTTFFLCGMSGILMGFLALERYCVICHQRGLPRILMWSVFFVAALTVAVLLTGNSLIGGFAPEPSHLFCMPKGTKWSKYANVTVDILFNLPLVVLAFCYISIFVKCYRSSIKSQTESVTRKAAIKSLCFLGIYFLCYIPKFSTTIIGIIYGLSSPPRFLYMMIPIGMTFLAVVNPILVLLLHRRVKDTVSSYMFAKKNYSIQLA